MDNSTEPVALHIRDLVHAYAGDSVLDGVTLDVAPGSVTVLLGPSGCGKTTLLRIIAGLDVPRSGSVSLGDIVLAGGDVWVRPEERRVGMVFQDWALFPHLDVRANIGFGLPKSERNGPRVDQLIELIGLTGLGKRMPSELSGGQQQRVALARAIAPRPKILLLDEPFSNLDATLRSGLRTEIHRLLADLGITSVLVTHDRDEAFVLADRVAVMHNGRIEQDSTPQDLYGRPVSRWVAEFLGGGTVLRGTARGPRVETAIGTIPLLDERHGDVEVWLRAEDIRAEPLDAHDSTSPGGRVGLTEFHGHQTMLFVDVDDHRIPVRCDSVDAPRTGDRVRLVVDRPVTSFEADVPPASGRGSELA